MPKLHEPTSGTDAEIDEGGTHLKQMASSTHYEHLMHKSHPAHNPSKGGYESLGSGVCITKTGNGKRGGA